MFMSRRVISKCMDANLWQLEKKIQWQEVKMKKKKKKEWAYNIIDVNIWIGHHLLLQLT